MPIVNKSTQYPFVVQSTKSNLDNISFIFSDNIKDWYGSGRKKKLREKYRDMKKDKNK